MNNAGFLSIENVRENQLANLSKQIDELREENDRLEDFNEELMEERNILNNIINKAKMYCEDVIQEHENGDYDVSTTQLAIEEHKKNIISLLNILNGDLENYWRSDKE